MEELHLDPIRQVRIAKLWAFAGITWAIVFPLLVYGLTHELSAWEIAVVMLPAAGVAFGSVELAARWEARTHRRYAYPHRLGFALASIHSFDEACAEAARSLGEWLGLRCVIVSVASEDGHFIRPVAAYGLPEGWLAGGHELNVSETGMDSRSGDWQECRRRGKDESWFGAPPGQDTVFIPLMSLGRPLGALTLVAEHNNPQIGDRRLLAAIAMVLGLALDNCRLYEGQRANAHHFEELHRMKSDFLTTVSHELRTPLTSIMMAAEMLLEEENPGERDGTRGRLVRNIVKGAVRLRSLVEDLVSVSRQDDFQPRLEPEPTALKDLLTGAVQIVQPLLTAKGQTLDVTMAHPNLTVRVDRLRFEQVLINLLSNAQRYSPPGGHVAVNAEKLDGDEIVICVTDSGPGVPQEDAAKIFEPFFRGDRSGLGLGLAIAKSIVELHRGRIWVEAAAGFGSRFCVTVPGTTSETPGDESGPEREFVPRHAPRHNIPSRQAHPR
jgi:signal transduction histidine kinase